MNAQDELKELLGNLPNTPISEPAATLMGLTYRPIDLSGFDLNDETDKPTMLARDKICSLLYAGKIHEFKGQPGHGKTWLALLAVAEQLKINKPVMYFDYEDNWRTVVKRLMSMSVSRATLENPDLFRYVRPAEAFGPEAAAFVDEALAEMKPVICVIDGVTEAMVQNNLNINDNYDSARFIESLPRRMAMAGAAVIQIDHLTKAADSRYSIGAQHKLAAIDGASYSIKMVEAFGMGRKGMAQVVLDKDRPGWLSQYALNGKHIADFIMHSSSDGTELSAVIEVPGGMGPDGRFVPTRMMESVSDYLIENKGRSIMLTELKKEVKGRAETIVEAVDALVEKGYASRESTGTRGANISLIKAFEAPVAYPEDDEDEDEDLRL